MAPVQAEVQTSRPGAPRVRIDTTVVQEVELPKEHNGLPVEGGPSAQSVPLCGMIGGIVRYPLWSGRLMSNGNGGFVPRIAYVAMDEHLQGGQGVTIAKARGWKECSEIPDEYAEIRDRHVAAIADWRRREQARADELERLKALGIKVPGSRTGVTGLANMG